MANTPKLPKAIGNNISTTLSGSITNSATSITVSDATGMETDGGYIIIDEGVSGKEEVVHVESISGNTLTISTDGRGQQGTSGVAHDSGATVTDILVKDHVNGLIDNGLYLRKADGTEVAVATLDGSDNILLGASGNNLSLYTKYRAKVYASTSQASFTTDTTLALDTELYDPNSNWDTGTYTYTAPVTGYYYIQYSAEVAVPAGTTRLVGQILLNGTNQHSSNTLTGVAGTATVQDNTIMLLTANDLVKFNINPLGVSVSTGVGAKPAYNTWASIHLISR